MFQYTQWLEIEILPVVTLPSVPQNFRVSLAIAPDGSGDGIKVQWDVPPNSPDGLAFQNNRLRVEYEKEVSPGTWSLSQTVDLPIDSGDYTFFPGIGKWRVRGIFVNIA
jgi:hypothetical protein